MTQKRVEDTIKEILVERLFLKLAPAEIGDDDVLADTLGIDSVSIFEIVVGLEETFGLSFENEEFKAATFRSVRAIADFVRSRPQRNQ